VSIKNLDNNDAWRLASLKANLHYGPWSQTMKEGLFQWSKFMVQLPWSDFSKFLFWKPCPPSLSVKQMWTKKIAHALKMNVPIFFIHAQKGQFWNNFKFDHHLGLLLGFTCLHFLLNVLKTWLANYHNLLNTHHQFFDN
jgi:hypothetical protein